MRSATGLGDLAAYFVGIAQELRRKTQDGGRGAAQQDGRLARGPSEQDARSARGRTGRVAFLSVGVPPSASSQWASSRSRANVAGFACGIEPSTSHFPRLLNFIRSESVTEPRRQRRRQLAVQTGWRISGVFRAYFQEGEYAAFGTYFSE